MDAAAVDEMIKGALFNSLLHFKTTEGSRGQERWRDVLTKAAQERGVELTRDVLDSILRNGIVDEDHEIYKAAKSFEACPTTLIETYWNEIMEPYSRHGAWKKNNTKTSKLLKEVSDEAIFQQIRASEASRAARDRSRSPDPHAELLEEVRNVIRARRS